MLTRTTVAAACLALSAPLALLASPGSMPERFPAGGVERPEPLTPHHGGDDDSEPLDASALSNIPCVDGFARVDGAARDFPCDSVDLASFTPLENLSPSSDRASDLWGWRDPTTGHEYALVGMRDGTSFVDVTDPTHPHWVAFMPTASGWSPWRDIKVVNDLAVVVSEARGHGMQVFDLTRLRGLEHGETVTLAADAWYRGFSNAHNIVVNEQSGSVHAVGTNTCSGGLHAVDLSDPMEPTFAGCFSSDGYTHDAQCVTYAGPDPDWQGREVCLLLNEDTLTIVDMSTPAEPVTIARRAYAARGYSHQGWLSEDQGFFFMGDELDEYFFGLNTRTLVWDVRDLDNPRHHSDHAGPSRAIDHNQYVKGQLLYQANYRAGLRIIDTGCEAEPGLEEVGYFDVWPWDDYPWFNGAWSVYPYLPSGTVLVSSIEFGLFALQPTGRAACPDVDPPSLSGVPADSVLECPDEPGPPGVTALDGCDDAPTLELAEERTPGDCPGRWTLVRTWTARDACGNETSEASTIHVDDTTAPVILESADVAACLWPPKHDLRWVPLADFTLDATDSCSSSFDWRLVACESNEPDLAQGSGASDADCIVDPDGLGVWVRSERSGRGAGRIYSVRAVAKDECGNESAPARVGIVVVPHDASTGC